jgi:UDP-N-acetyl-D-glucosamine dehydrogenase
VQATQVLAPETSPLDGLKQKIDSRTAKVGLIGLGYAGLPLAVAFAEQGFPVTGVDLQDVRVDALNRGDSYIGDIPSERIDPLVREQRLRATTDSPHSPMLTPLLSVYRLR